MKIIFLMLVLCLNFSCTSTILRMPQGLSSAQPLQVSQMFYRTNSMIVNDVNLRTGFMKESDKTEFRGCVLYLEGLGDSILNHAPLFHSLSKAGYRILAFDYMGQGGSEGTMNFTKIYDPLSKGMEIGKQAKQVWEKYSTEAYSDKGKSCATSKKMLIGWSTGGLAAYSLANDGWADAVVLIAPGINPNEFVGEAANDPKLFLNLGPVITERTLTTQNYANTYNPHIDPIKPNSPMLVPFFSANLLFTAQLSQRWRIPDQVKGLVFLSGSRDTYVDADASRKTLREKAPHFTVISYEGALHEIDNEVPEIALELYQKTIKFFNGI